VVILSHRLWQSRMNSDPAIIGRSITLAGKPQTVVGVLPAHLLFPDLADEPDLYVPADLVTDKSLATTNLSVTLVVCQGHRAAPRGRHAARGSVGPQAFWRDTVERLCPVFRELG
jgi:hypothetical protein